MSFQKQTYFTFESYYKLKSQAALLNFNFNQIDDLFKLSNIKTTNDKTSKNLLATESSWKPFSIQLNQCCCWCSRDIQNTNYYLVNYYLTGIINDVSQSVDVFICIRDFIKFFKISF